MTQETYTFDLRDQPSGMARFHFYPNAVAAWSIPEAIGDMISFLVWGVMIDDPLQHKGLREVLPADVRAQLPTPLCLSGWGVVTFHEVCSATVAVNPFAPRLSEGKWEQLAGPDGQPVQFVRQWTLNTDADAIEYNFEFQLEQPRGWMGLSVATKGAIDLTINPADCVTFQKASEQYGSYTHDWYRSRQLLQIKTQFGIK